MIKISGCDELEKRFNTLKSELTDSIIKFIQQKKNNESLNLSQEKCLERFSKKYNRLSELALLEGMLDHNC